MGALSVKIRRTMNGGGKLKAIVSVTLNHEFVIHDVKLVQGKQGLFVAMPSRRLPTGEFLDVAHPINAGVRERIEAAVIAAYEEALNGAFAEAAAAKDVI